MRRSGRSKYNVDNSDAGREARTVDNILFASKHEAAVYANYIRPNVRAGIFRNLEMQKRFPLTVNGVKICTYVADFQYETLDGKVHTVDAKGAVTAVYRMKRALFLACTGIAIEEM